MQMLSNEQNSKDYIVVLRAPSSLLFEANDSLIINTHDERGVQRLIIRTRYIERGLEQPLPGNLWLEGSVIASSIEEGVSMVGNYASSIISIIAFCTNAAVGTLDPEIAYDNSQGASEREFLRSMLPIEKPIPHKARKVDKDAVLSVMNGIKDNQEKARIMRAITQYLFALRYWRWGIESLATAHLYMGIETLTKSVARGYQSEMGMNDPEFAEYLGLDIDTIDPCANLITLIEAAVRRNVIFQGDNESHKKAKAASDGFEHGFMHFGEILNLAKDVRDQTAQYLRKSILDLILTDTEIKDKLLAPPFDQPLGHWPIVKYARGLLKGDTEKLAKNSEHYPHLAWKSRVSSVDVDGEGNLTINFNESIDPQLGDEIEFELTRFEVWTP